MNARWLFIVLLVLISLSILGWQGSTVACANRLNQDDIFKKEPALMLWAWEYPCDLQFVNPKKTGVAFLVGRVTLTDGSVLVKPRIQTIKVGTGTYMMAVVRIETNRQKPPIFSDEQLETLVVRVTELLSIKSVQALQIDFDARQSERSFYRRFLQVLVKRIPSSMPLSITSLASWCLRDPWIKDLPCNEIVPMFFSMGKDRKRMLSLLKSDYGLAKGPLTNSIGLSIDEPDVLAGLPALSKHIYLFSSKGWNTSQAIDWVKGFETGGARWQELVMQ